MVKVCRIVALMISFMSISRVYCFLRPHRAFASRLHQAQAVTTPTENALKFSCRADRDIEWMGNQISKILSPGDVLLLRGDLGAGKTTFSRGIVRGKFEDNEMVVTSPSYLLDNMYTYGPDEHIHHMDLYRLPPHADLGILGIPAIFNTAVCLIEWPERLSANLLPTSYLDVQISISDGNCLDNDGVVSIEPPMPPSSSLKPSDLDISSDNESDSDEGDDLSEGLDGATTYPGRIVTLRCEGERWVAKKDALVDLLSIVSSDGVVR